MPRNMHERYDEAFRVVVVTTSQWDAGDRPTVCTEYYGPYASESVAKGIVSSENKEAARSVWRRNRHHYSVECKIQRSVVEWEDWS